jgi:hypothetical protein
MTAHSMVKRRGESGKIHGGRRKCGKVDADSRQATVRTKMKTIMVMAEFSWQETDSPQKIHRQISNDNNTHLSIDFAYFYAQLNLAPSHHHTISYCY